ncbi:uncharacterized protein [Prorops nasuta]|uniref:uncharacterized protein n=1 Tax=Prorops nasuta TaxID=863751 RepID=UPI0034CEB9E9
MIADESDEYNLNCTPPSIVEAANSATLNLLPKKSKQKYETIYDKFIKWREENKVTSFSENVLLAYFAILKMNYKPSTLWSHYSILNSIISIKHNINIAKYCKLHSFLKQESSGYIPKKAKTLTSEEINTFLKEAPDTDYLMIKVALGIGIMGACRREELYNLLINDVEVFDNTILVNIPTNKTNKPRAFTLIGTISNLCKKYINLRPNGMENKKFFLKYTKGRCSKQVVGINTFGKMSKDIAIFLKLKDPQLYTGHTFRRSSATLLVDAGGDLLALKRHGGWKSNSTAEGYIDNSIQNKLDTANK